MAKGISAVVLAGGFASRMGRCKSLLPVFGKTAIEIIAARMKTAGISDITAVTGHYSEHVAREAERIGISRVHNPNYESGMFSSVAAGIKSLPSSSRAFFILPADIPLVKAYTYKILIEIINETGVDAVYPTFLGRKAHPPLLSLNLAEKILGWRGEGGLGGFLANTPHRAVDVPVGDRAVILDMDTPDDYARLLKYAERESYPDEDECGEILRMEGTPERTVLHSRAVEKNSGMIAAALKKKGMEINEKLLASASLLHDIAKGRSGHETVGAGMLRLRGFREAGDVVASHKDLPEWGKITEREILFLADKITEGAKTLRIDEREKSIAEKFRYDAESLRAAKRRLNTAKEIQSEIEKITGMTLEQILGGDKV